MSKRKKQPLRLVGISGKPGSVKMRYAAPIIQELRFHGYSTVQSSLAGALYKELNSLIDDWHASGESQDAIHILGEKYGLLESGKYHDVLSLIGAEGLGERFDFGFSRRNENMRKSLALFAELRREQDEDYFLKRMIESIPEGTEFAVFTDLRYPNEAEYLAYNEGFAIRIVNPPQGAYADPEDGYKYSAEGLNDPSETALDDYDNWYDVVHPDGFLGRDFVLEMLDDLFLPTREEQVGTPSTVQEI